jgi:Na+/H+ antiporter NhaD/arsenite permease-like protein
MPLSLIILGSIFFSVALRHQLPFKIAIWQIFTIGAILMLATAQITPMQAVVSIKWDVILFLFGAFTLGESLAASGILSSFCRRFFLKASDPRLILALFLISAALASAFLTKDTIAVIATPIAIVLARRFGVSNNLFLLGLCFCISIGSMLTPIGNPQNVLVAVSSNMGTPFLTFFNYLAAPTFVNLIVCYFWLRWCYRSDLKNSVLNNESIDFFDTNNSSDKAAQNVIWPVYLSVFLFLLMVCYDAFAQFFKMASPLPIGALSVIACLPIYCFSNNRGKILRHLDWHTLVLFVSLFVVMSAVWHAHFFQYWIANSKLDLQNPSVVVLLSLTGSQLISNVPLVQLYLPFIHYDHLISYVCLAMGSTMASNIFIISAASNMIVVQMAEKKGINTLTFWRFAVVGTPLACVNVLVYLLWIYGVMGV